MTPDCDCRLCVDCQDRSTREVTVAKDRERIHQWFQDLGVEPQVKTGALFSLPAVLRVSVLALENRSVEWKEVVGGR